MKDDAEDAGSSASKAKLKELGRWLWRSGGRNSHEKLFLGLCTVGVRPGGLLRDSSLLAKAEGGVPGHDLEQLRRTASG